MPPFPVDPDSQTQKECFALVRVTKKTRKRFPEACVTPINSEKEAHELSSNDSNLHPAVVYGPSVSSESQRIYHLIRWLD